jgi:AhpD family alkylhydroperoxidase
MEPRMKSAALSVPGLLDTIQALSKVIHEAAGAGGVPRTTLDLIGMRASQINGCAVCLDLHSRGARRAGETDQRLDTLAAWRETPYFSDAERAALALTEAGTRLADRADPVVDEVFREAAEHYDEQGLGAIVTAIAAINLWNRLNVVTGQVAGEWTQHWVA